MLLYGREEDIKHFWVGGGGGEGGGGEVGGGGEEGDFCRHNIKTWKSWPDFLKFQSMSIRHP